MQSLYQKNAMKNQNFEQLGKKKAILQLYDNSNFKSLHKNSCPIKESGELVTSAKLMTEGIDFNLCYFPLKHIGYKSVISVTGELYSKLAKPKILNVVLGISSKLDYPQIEEIWQGITTCAEEHNYEGVDLDLVPSVNGLILNISATGICPERICSKKSKSKSKDLICISGNVGGAFFGMQILEKELELFEKGIAVKETPKMEKHRMMISSYLMPRLDSEIVEKFEEDGIYPSHGFLVTKGLGDAVKRLAYESGLGVKIYADKIPFEGNSFDLGKELNIDPISAAMNGGEEYRLMYTIPLSDFEKIKKAFPSFEIIGHLALKEVKDVLVTPDGIEIPIKAQGWEENVQE